MVVSIQYKVTAGDQHSNSLGNSLLPLGSVDTWSCPSTKAKHHLNHSGEGLWGRANDYFHVQRRSGFEDHIIYKWWWEIHWYRRNKESNGLYCVNSWYSAFQPNNENYIGTKDMMLLHKRLTYSNENTVKETCRMASQVVSILRAFPARHPCIVRKASRLLFKSEFEKSLELRDISNSGLSGSLIISFYGSKYSCNLMYQHY